MLEIDFNSIKSPNTTYSVNAYSKALDLLCQLEISISKEIS